MSNSELCKKFNEINRDPKLLKKFLLVIEAVKSGVDNKFQYNFEGSLKNDSGKIFAIKVDSHRFYTLQIINNGTKELYICRYGKKESQKNDTAINAILKSIQVIEINQILIWNN